MCLIDTRWRTTMCPSYVAGTNWARVASRRAYPSDGPWRDDDRIVAGAGEEPRGGRERRRADAGQSDTRRAVLLLHRRDHVVDPRRLHVVRDRHRAQEERARHGDEEHPDDRRRHAVVLLLRVVDLQLQPARAPDRAELE